MKYARPQSDLDENSGQKSKIQSSVFNSAR